MKTTEEPDPRTSHGECARFYAMTDVPTCASEDRAGEVVAALQGRRFVSLDHVYVVRGEVFVGAVAMTEVFAAPSDVPVRELIAARIPAVGPQVDQEAVAGLAVRHGCTALPVVTDDGRFLGAVTAQALLSILRREHVEDLHRLAGIQREGQRSLAALEDPPARRARHRLPWLLLGLAGSLGAAMLMAGFENLLAANLQVAYFLPAIVYLADAVGTQTEAIAVRGLSLARLSWRRILGGEIRTGVWIGLVLAALAAPVIALWTADPALGATVGLSLFLACSLACGIGLGLPVLFSRWGTDPAFGSGPLATILQDLLSVATYLTVAQCILG